MSEDARWLAAAASVAARARPASRPNPAVGAVIVKEGRVVARGWTGDGGRPHAEAAALAAAGEAAKGATMYVTLEPCAHVSERGPSCATLIANSGLARVVVGCEDPDPRTVGKGVAWIRTAGIFVALLDSPEAEASLAGYLTQRRLGRPHVTLKLALSLDGYLGNQPGGERWLTGEAARAHCHALRAKADAILVGGGTLRADSPRLDVRLPGLDMRSPERWVLTRQQAPEGWRALRSPEAISDMQDVQYLFVEGGAETARGFLSAGLIDQLLIYRAPVTVGHGAPYLPEFAAPLLSWHQVDSRQLGNDVLEVYERNPCSPE
jgi:diaminohydroxyphosphoribosylaminopyrimidine deaminase / 5-amino-6-(5-phosphoribosylamino)uracil reductase